MKLDQIDLNILAELQDNGRKSYRKIAQVLGLNERTVKERVNRMLREDVFSFMIYVHPNQHQRTEHVLIGLTTKAGFQDQIAKELSQFDPIHFISAFSGEKNLILQASFKSKVELIVFINDHLSKIRGIIRIDLNLELKPYKRSFSQIHVQ